MSLPEGLIFGGLNLRRDPRPTRYDLATTVYIEHFDLIQTEVIGMGAEAGGGVTWDHVSVNVSDMERSTRFYREGLGFEHIEDNTLGTEAAATNRVDGDFRMHSRYLKGGSVLLILNLLLVPTEPLPRPRQQLGLSNFAVRVESLESAIQRVNAAGGEVFEDTRSNFDLGQGLRANVVVCADPDGQWIELVEHAAAE